MFLIEKIREEKTAEKLLLFEDIRALLL